MNRSVTQLDQTNQVKEDGNTIAREEKKTNSDPVPKNDAPSEDKSASAVETSKAEGGKIADAVSYSRGERQKPVSQAYRDK